MNKNFHQSIARITVLRIKKYQGKVTSLMPFCDDGNAEIP